MSKNCWITGIRYVVRLGLFCMSCDKLQCPQFLESHIDCSFLLSFLRTITWQWNPPELLAGRDQMSAAGLLTWGESKPCGGLAQVLVRETPLWREHHGEMVGHVVRPSLSPKSWIFTTLTWTPLARSYHQNVKTGPSKQWTWKWGEGLGFLNGHFKRYIALERSPYRPWSSSHELSRQEPFWILSECLL